MERIIKAGPEHMIAVWEWRNDVTSRCMSLSSDYIPLEQHQKWYSRSLADPSKKLFIYETDGEPTAIVRFDIAEIDAEISVNVAPAQRGKGVGTRAIRAAIQAVRGVFPDIRTITANVKKINESSLNAFTKSEFKVTGESEGIVTLKHDFL